MNNIEPSSTSKTVNGSFIQQLSMRGKFTLMLFFPIVAMLFFSITNILEKTQLGKQTESTSELIQFAVLTSSLVHET
jgi:hypothetical protein